MHTFWLGVAAAYRSVIPAPIHTGRAGTGFVCFCVGPRSRRLRVPLTHKHDIPNTPNLEPHMARLHRLGFRGAGRVRIRSP
jgi:hypothetical protein